MSDTPPRALSGPPRRWRRYLMLLVVPLGLLALGLYALEDPLEQYLSGQGGYDETALRDWLDEARFSRDTLRELVDTYSAACQELQELPVPTRVTPWPPIDTTVQNAVSDHREMIRSHLEALGTPTRQSMRASSRLFPVIYRIEIHFHDNQRQAHRLGFAAARAFPPGAEPGPQRE